MAKSPEEFFKTEATIGDVVTLKSGSPPMTVIGKAPQSGATNETMVMCCWFGPNLQPSQVAVDARALRVVPVTKEEEKKLAPLTAVPPSGA